MDDELFDQALQKLTVVRMPLQEDEPISEDDFHVRVLGGPWLLKTKGIPLDANQGFARTELSKQFCAKRGWQKTIRFDRALYGA